MLLWALHPRYVLRFPHFITISIARKTKIMISFGDSDSSPDTHPPHHHEILVKSWMSINIYGNSLSHGGPATFMFHIFNELEDIMFYVNLITAEAECYYIYRSQSICIDILFWYREVICINKNCCRMVFVDTYL